MRIILIYLVLLTFYINQVLGAVGLSFKGFSLFNLNIYLLLFVWAAVALKRKKIFLSNNVNKYIVLLGIIVFASVFVKILLGEIPDISIKYEVISFKNWLNPLLLFFILYNIIEDKETCNRTLWGLYFLIFASILTQLLATFGITSYQAQTIESFGRAGGFGAAGEYAITLVLLFPFVLSGSFLMKRSGLFKIGCIILVFLILVGVVNAGSRNGVVSFFCCMIVYLLILKRKKIIGIIPIYFLIISMIMASVTAFVISPSSVKMSMSERFNPYNAEDLSHFTSGRILLWESGWKLFVKSPIFGHGQDSFKILSYLGPPHNEYLKYLTEQGLIGLFLFLMIFFRIYQNVRQSLEATKDSWESQLYISYLAGLCGFMVGIFATNTGPSLVIFWIYTAVIYKYTQLDKDKMQISKIRSETVNIPSSL